MFIIGIILLVMNYNHPFSSNARIYFTTTPILPDVKGRVIEVPVEPNTLLKAGDVLFRVDPQPYQYVVDQKKALLAEAEQSVKQLKSAYDQALANVEKFSVQVKLAQDEYDRQVYLLEKKVIAQSTLDTATRNVDAAKQALAGAQAAAESARLAFTSEIGGVNTTVARLQAELGDAQFDLDQTVVRAPGAGYVTQMVLRPGMYVVPAPLRPVMVFVHKDDEQLAAGFQQNSLQRIRAGDEAEIAFDGIPGQVFKGKVKHVLDAIATGQLQATGSLQDMGADVEGGPPPSLTLMRICLPTTFPAAQRPRSRFTRHSPTTSLSFDAFCCGCEAGRISYFLRVTAGVVPAGISWGKEVNAG